MNNVEPRRRPIIRTPDAVFTEALSAHDLNAEAARALREAVRPWWFNVESYPYHALLASFLLYRHRGEPLIAAIRRAIDGETVDLDIAFYLLDVIGDVAIETQRPSDPELDAAPPLSRERERRKEVLLVAYLRRCGEAEMAQMLEDEPNVYYALSDRGRRKLAKRSM